MTGKGIIEGYIRSTWYEENRPRSTTADAIEQSLGHFRESSYEDFIKEHPEALQKATINEENLLKRIKDLEGTIIEMKQNADKATQEINELRASRAQIVESSKAEPEIQQNTPKLIRNEYLLKFRVERTWKVSFKDENFTEVDLDHTIKVPEDYGGYLPLRVSIENEEGGRRISLTQFDIHVLDRDHYETLFNRLRSLLTEYLLNGEVDTDIPINESFGERMGFYPKLEGGDVWRLQIGKIDSRHFRGGCLLMVRLGESYLRYTMRIPREGLAIFVENISDLVEMILKSGGELKEKVG